MQSVIENAYDDLIAEVKTITTGNGYRNTLANVSQVFLDLDQITDYPHVCIVFNDGSVDAISDNKTSFSEHVEVGVIGYISGDTSDKLADIELFDKAESLIHDFKKCLAGFISKYLNTANKRYLIEGKEGLFRIFRILPIAKNKGMVGIMFKIKIHSEDSTFA